MRKLIYYLLLFNPALLLAQQEGSLDSLFGTNGITKYAFFPDKYTALSSVLKVFSDGTGNIYLYGTSSNSDGTTRLCMTRLKSDGKTDSSFGLNGRVYFAASQWLSSSTSLIHIGVDSLNRIVFGRPDFSILRFLSTGSADTSFGTNGYMKFNASGSLNALHVLPNGKLLALGNTSAVCLTVRFNENGGLDSGFNNSGIVVGAFNTGVYKNEGKGLHVQLDGKIVVVGNAYNQYNCDFGLMRLHANGLLDSSFGSNGITKVNFDYGNDFVSKTSLISQGGLLVLGTMQLLSGGTNTIVVKFLPNGQIDPSFGVSGKYVTSSSYAEFLGWRNDCVLFGYISSGDVTLKNYLKTGSLDPSFGNAGTLVIGKSKYPLLNLNSLVVYDSNHLVFGGYIDSLNNRGFGVIKVDGLGRIDSTMGLNGLGFIQMGTPYLNTTSSGKLSKISVQPDKKIVIVGSVIPGSYRRMLVSRFLPNGQKDIGFGVNGTLILDDGMAKGVLTLADTTILVSGYINSNNVKKAILFKLKQDGTYDSTFAVNGRNVVGKQLANGLNEFNDIDLQSDGKIIVTGSGLGRFLANGQLDSSFGVNGFNQGIYGVNSVVLKDNSIVVAGDTILSKYSANGEVRMWFYHETWSKYCGFTTGNSYFKYSYYEPLIDNDDNIFVRGGRYFDPEYNANIACLNDNGGDVQFLFNKDGVPVSSFGTGGKVIRTGLNLKTGVLSLGSKVLSFSNYYSSYTIYQNLPNGSPFGPFGGAGKIDFNIPIIGSSTLPKLFHPCFQSDSTVVFSFLSLDTIFFARHFIRKDKLVDFTVTSKKTGFLTDTFQLHASGSPGITNYHWVIDNVVYLNGTDSSSAAPYIKFLTSGYKTIKLVGIINEGEIIEKIKTNFITVCKVDFDATSNFEEVLVPIQIMNLCFPIPSSFRWEIEGKPAVYIGYHLNSPSPYFRYLDTGSFAVTLIAKYANGDSLVLSKPNFFRINSLAFTQDKSYSNLDSPYFNFYAHSKPAAMRYAWQASAASGQTGNPISFPNGNELANVKVVVSDTGWYNMQLTAYYDSSHTLVKVKNLAFYVSAILNTNKPLAGFKVNKQFGDIDELFYFTDSSLFHPNSWEWTFIPDNVWLVSSDYHSQNPIVSFYADGIYDVKLKVGNPFGKDSVLKKAYITIGVTGQKSLLPGIQFNLFPNPANDLLFLRFSQEIESEYQIYSSNGALVGEGNLNESINGLNQIDVSYLPSGFYQIRVKTERGEAGKSFILSR
jgi:uncharacterized delta-60 repeat protein